MLTCLSSGTLIWSYLLTYSMKASWIEYILPTLHSPLSFTRACFLRWLAYSSFLFCVSTFAAPLTGFSEGDEDEYRSPLKEEIEDLELPLTPEIFHRESIAHELLVDPELSAISQRLREIEAADSPSEEEFTRTLSEGDGAFCSPFSVIFLLTYSKLTL